MTYGSRVNGWVLRHMIKPYSYEFLPPADKIEYYQETVEKILNRIKAEIPHDVMMEHMIGVDFEEEDYDPRDVELTVYKIIKEILG